MQLLEHFINPRQGILVPDCYSVESSVINTKTPSTIIFWDKKDGRTKRRGGGTDEASFKQLLQLGPEFSKLNSDQWIDGGVWRT